MSLLHFVLRGFGPDAGSPATPTLAVSDNADGTGGVATVTNADANASITIYSQAVDGDLGTATWVSRGTRTGNGTVNLSITATGFYWFKAVATRSGGSSVSNLVYAAITGASESVWFQILAAVQARVQGLSLSGVSSSNIDVRKVPSDRNLTLPGIVICGLKEAAPPLQGTVNLDDVIYPVLIGCIEADNQESTLTANLNRHTLWRQTIRRSFHAQPRLAGVPTVINSFVEPSELCSFDGWRNNKWASGLIVRFTSREPRTI